MATSPLATAVTSELRRLLAALRALSFRPIVGPPEVDGTRCFGAMASGEYTQVVVGVLLLLAIEIPLVHLILGSVLDPGPWRLLVRTGLLAGSVYLGIWLIGDLRLLRESAGLCVDADRIRVALGLRVQGEVPFTDIARVEDLTGRPEDEVARDAERAIRISPRSDPNVRIELRRRVSMTGVFGLPLAGDVLHIHVDDPADLIRALRSSLPKP